MEIIWGTTPELNQFYRGWCALRVFNNQASEFDRAYKCFGVHNKGRLVAVVVYHNWDVDAGVVEISGAADSKLWLTRPVIQTLYDYAFVDLKCQMIVQRIPDRQRAMQRIFRAMGYNVYHIPRLAGPNEGTSLGTFTTEQWATHRLNGATLDVSHPGKEFAQA